jgi:apolipoprotein N-acyltransferase
VGVVQPNIAEDQKHEDQMIARTIGVLADATRQLVAADHPQLIVWPETALPDFLYRHRDWSDSLHVLTLAADAPLLTGFVDLVWHDSTSYDYYNAAMVVDADGRVRQPVYHKRRLVPVVERVPFLNPNWFHWAGQYFGGFGVGAGPVVYQAPLGKFGVLVCYESIFPGESREYRNDGADFLINITNDAWFGHSNAPYEHYSHLVLRAIENRTAVVRSANTGISGWIDPLGRIRAATPIFTPQTATYALETSDARTPYDALGDFMGLLSVAVTLALTARAWWAARRAARGEAA